MATILTAGSVLRLPWRAARGALVASRDGFWGAADASREALGAAGVRLVRAIAGAWTRGVAGLARSYARHRQGSELRELNDLMLKDIGLSRDDVPRDWRRSFWEW